MLIESSCLSSHCRTISAFFETRSIWPRLSADRLALSAKEFLSSRYRLVLSVSYLHGDLLPQLRHLLLYVLHRVRLKGYERPVDVLENEQLRVVLHSRLHDVEVALDLLFDLQEFDTDALQLFYFQCPLSHELPKLIIGVHYLYHLQLCLVKFSVIPEQVLYLVFRVGRLCVELQQLLLQLRPYPQDAQPVLILHQFIEPFVESLAFRVDIPKVEQLLKREHYVQQAELGHLLNLRTYLFKDRLQEHFEKDRILEDGHPRISLDAVL